MAANSRKSILTAIAVLAIATAFSSAVFAAAPADPAESSVAVRAATGDPMAEVIKTYPGDSPTILFNYDVDKIQSITIDGEELVLDWDYFIYEFEVVEVYLSYRMTESLSLGDHELKVYTTDGVMTSTLEVAEEGTAPAIKGDKTLWITMICIITGIVLAVVIIGYISNLEKNEQIEPFSPEDNYWKKK